MLFMCHCLSAQEIKPNVFEAGVGYVPFQLVTSDGGTHYKSIFNGYFEWRHSAGKHFDFGARLDYKGSPARYAATARDPIEQVKGFSNFIGIWGVTDFNLFPGKTVNPFIGVCLGPEFELSVWDSVPNYTNLYLCCTPRFGLELFGRLRLSAGVDFCVLGYAELLWPMCFSIGWEF